MKTIELTRGYKAIVDDEDYLFLSQFNWAATTPRKNKDVQPYRGIKKPKRINILMKRVIMAREIESYAKIHNLTLSEACVDFKNHNTLDLRKENMVVCKHEHTCKHYRKSQLHKGYSWSKFHKAFSVKVNDSIYSKEKRGLVDTELEAMNLYNHWAEELNGEYASKFSCEFIPLEKIKIRKYDKVKQANQLEKTRKYTAELKTLKGRCYNWSKQNKAFCVRIRDKFYGHFKEEEDAKKKVIEIKNQLFNP
jgi:hypothetical protein